MQGSLMGTSQTHAASKSAWLSLYRVEGLELGAGVTMTKATRIS